MQRRFACAAAALGLLCARPASADSLSALRSELMTERAHDVSVTLSPGWAELVVRRTVHNGGERHDQAMFFLDMPAGAVAIGLRTRGELDGRPHWFRGELLEAEAAAERYRELTGIGGYYPKDPALLSWRDPSLLALQVFPVAPVSEKMVEYTLLLPTEYRGGRHHVRLPAMGTDTLLASVTAQPGPSGGKLFLGDARLRDGRVPLSRDEEVDLSVTPLRPPVLGARLAMAELPSGRAMVHFRVEAAPVLAPAPRGAHVVVLIDASRSIDEDVLRAEVAAARAYLQGFPDARASVLFFDREPRPLEPGFVTAEQARADLAAAPLTLRNGSDVELALLEAERRLMGAPRSAAKRILLLTDTLMRQSLDGERLRGSVGRSGALVHVGIVASGEPALERNDEHAWSSLARSTGGLVWNAVVDPDANADAAVRSTVEEWVRPKRIHHLKMSAPRVDAGRLLGTGELPEGEGTAGVWIEQAAVPWLRVEGELWAEPVKLFVEPDAEETRRWSALVFGSEALGELEESDMMTLALRGGAVSPVTSYLAIEPGVRPSTEGIEWGEGLGVVRMGATGVGFGSGSGSGSHIDLEGLLRRELARVRDACGATGKMELALETTIAEIVAVEAPRFDTADPARDRCIVAGVWETVLPGAFTSEWQSWDVTAD